MIMYPDYKNSILNVSATIIKHYQGQSIYDSIRSLEEELKVDPKHVFLVLLDGMGINIINKYLSPEDFLRKHVKQTITSVFPPTTVAATNAVLSGLPSYASGYLGWVQYFKHEKTNAVVFTNEDFYDRSIKIEVILRDKYLKYPTIYEQIQKHSSHVKTYELFPSFRPNGYENLDKQIERAIEISNIEESNFTYLYWTEPDLTQHDYGTDSDITKAKLLELNRLMDKLAKEVNHNSMIVIIADHGLINVEGIDLFDDNDLMRMLKRKPSIEARATNFFVKKLHKKKFKQMFEMKYGKYFKLYSKEELYQSELLGFGQKHPLLDDFLGDFLAISITDKMFNLKEHSRFIGHHAGLTQDEMEVPLIIYHQV